MAGALGALFVWLIRRQLQESTGWLTVKGRPYSLSRMVSAILPFVALNALVAFGSGWVFAGSAVLMALLRVDVAALGPRTTGRALEPAAAAAPPASG